MWQLRIRQYFRPVCSALSCRSIERILTFALAAQDYFDYSMSLADSRFDTNYGYVWYNDNGPWSNRFTAWYIPGLLQRNKGDDVANAQKAMMNL
jgi:hypothetical protein